MTVGYSVDLRNAQLDAITTIADVDAIMRIYDGSRPATGDPVTSQTMLVELQWNGTFADVASGGVLPLFNPDPGTAVADGTATWFRVVLADGTTFVMDGDCSGLGGGGDAELTTTTITNGMSVEVTFGEITRGNP